jgi:hypothetical protein
LICAIHTSTCGLCPHILGGKCRITRWPNINFMGCVGIYLATPLCLDDTCGQWIFGLALTTFFFFLLFYLLLDFHAKPFNVSKQPFDLFFLQIWSFFLFEIIYKIKKNFNFILLQFFSSIIFGPHSFDCYFLFILFFNFIPYVYL